jgi:DNA-binding transcriptional regulator GbsR (MarR family)
MHKIFRFIIIVFLLVAPVIMVANFQKLIKLANFQYLIKVDYFHDEIYNIYYNIFPEKLQRKIIENESKLKELENLLSNKEPNLERYFDVTRILKTLDELNPTEKKYSKKIKYYNNKVKNILDDVLGEIKKYEQEERIK